MGTTEKNIKKLWLSLLVSILTFLFSIYVYAGDLSREEKSNCFDNAINAFDQVVSQEDGDHDDAVNNFKLFYVECATSEANDSNDSPDYFVEAP